MRFGSVCSGIEAASTAWEPLGWEAAWFSEIEPFPCAVLKHRHPRVPNHGDMTTLPARILAGEVEAPDVLVGGTPCQSFSVAGLRQGLKDPRGQLTRTYVEICDAIDTVRSAAGKPPVILVWENVPGVLSDNGNAFGNFLGALSGEDGALQPPGGKWTNAGLVCGPTRDLAWRVLDAQYFGVAQRRRRVFLVGHSRAGAVRPVKVLLVEQGVQRHSAPSREAGQRAAAAPVTGTQGGGGLGTDFDLDGGLVRHDGGVGGVAIPLLDASKGRTDNRGSRDGSAIGDNGDPMFTLRAGSSHGVAHVVAPPLTASNDPSRSPQSSEVTQQVEAVLRAQYPEIAEVCGTISDGAHNGGGLNGQDAYTGRILPVVQCATGDRTHALTTRSAAEEDGTGRGTPIVPARSVALRGRDGGDGVIPIDLRQAARGERDTNARTTGGAPGTGVGDAGDPAYTVSARQQAVAAPVVATTMAVRRLMEYDTLQMGGISHGTAAKARSREVLRLLCVAIGEKAFAEWGLGVLASFLPAEVLRKAVHGLGLRCPTIEEFGLVNYALPREEDRAARAVLQVWRFVGEGCPSFGWEPHEQRSVELGAYLSELSQPGASAESVMSDLRAACERDGVLQQALSAVQEVGRPVCREAQPAHAALAVRRLVPEECEFLQGFPRNWTRIPWKNKPASECPDGPRYKALGNSMAVPCMYWIGWQIQKAMT